MSRSDGLSPQHVTLARELGFGKRVLARAINGHRHYRWDFTPEEEAIIRVEYAKRRALAIAARHARRKERRAGIRPAGKGGRPPRDGYYVLRNQRPGDDERAARWAEQLRGEGLLTEGEIQARVRELYGSGAWSAAKMKFSDLAERRVSSEWRREHVAEYASRRNG